MAYANLKLKVNIGSLWAGNSYGIYCINGDISKNDIDNFLCMQQQLWAEEMGWA